MSHVEESQGQQGRELPEGEQCRQEVLEQGRQLPEGEQRIQAQQGRELLREGCPKELENYKFVVNSTPIEIFSIGIPSRRPATAQHLTYQNGRNCLLSPMLAAVCVLELAPGRG